MVFNVLSQPAAAPQCVAIVHSARGRLRLLSNQNSRVRLLYNENAISPRDAEESAEFSRQDQDPGGPMSSLSADATSDDRGWFVVHRAVFNHPLFDGHPFSPREAWLWLIAEAAWKPRKRKIAGHIIELERGQLAHSLRFMAEAWRWQKDRVHRFLDSLETDVMIKRKKPLRQREKSAKRSRFDKNATANATAVSVITICNYERFQSALSESATVDATAARQQCDSSATNHNNLTIEEEERERATRAPYSQDKKSRKSPKPRKARTAPTPIPDKPTQAMIAHAKARGWDDATIAQQFKRMDLDYRAFKNGRRTVVSWEACWEIWCNRHDEYVRSRPQPGQPMTYKEQQRKKWEDVLKDLDQSIERRQRSEFDNGNVIDGQATEIPETAPKRLSNGGLTAEQERDRLKARVTELQAIIDADPTSEAARKASYERSQCWGRLSELPRNPN